MWTTIKMQMVGQSMIKMVQESFKKISFKNFKMLKFMLSTQMYKLDWITQSLNLKLEQKVQR